jgi:hypothetical protein
MSLCLEIFDITTERDLGGDPIVYWLDRVDAFGKFIFFIQRGPPTQLDCGMYVTDFARRRANPPTLAAVPWIPELAVACAGGDYRSSSTYE